MSWKLLNYLMCILKLRKYINILWMKAKFLTV